jgi:translation initiation factor IF-2
MLLVMPFALCNDWLNEEDGMKEIEVGVVADYFAKIGVVAIKITAEGIKAGDVLHFQGHTTDFSQKIGSMQIEHETVEEAGVGSEVGIKVDERVRVHDHVYLVRSE